MNSSGELVVNVSLSNIKASVETFLRSMKVIKDSEQVSLSFDVNKNWADDTAIPVYITIKEEAKSKIDQIKERLRKKNSDTQLSQRD